MPGSPSGVTSGIESNRGVIERLTVVTFAENAGRTTVKVLWLPLDATDADLAAFNAGRAGATAGWNGPFEQLAAYLAEIKARA